MLCALLLIAVPGCWTGRLIESGRLHESVVTYTSAALDSEALRLNYRVEVSDARGRPRSREERSATVALATLAARPERPVDETPVRRVPTGSHTGREVPVALVISRHDAAPVVVAGSPGIQMVLQVYEHDGRHAGFRVCSTTRTRCLGHFHSGALYRDHIAWWVYPVAPLTATVDLALLPLQAVTLPLTLAFGD